MNLVLQAIKSLIRKVETLIPTKLSHLENDLYDTNKKIPARYLNTSSLERKITNVEDYVNDVNSYVGTVEASVYSKLNSNNPVATGSFSMNKKSGTSTGTYSHTEGYNCAATAQAAHAEGNNSVASGKGSHAEGEHTEAVGEFSHAEGRYTKALGAYSHVEGRYNQVNLVETMAATASVSTAKTTDQYGYLVEEYTIDTKNGVFVISNLPAAKTLVSDLVTDKYYAKFTPEDPSATTHTVTELVYVVKVQINGTNAAVSQKKVTISELYAHSLGNGTSNTKSNAHTIDWEGNATFAGTVTGIGADYAEYFEWADDNPDKEDRIGVIVALEGDKIRPATPDDDILGITTGTAMVVGDNAEWEWRHKYQVDDYGRVITEMVEEFREEVNEETGETEQVLVGIFPQRKLNPDFDPDKNYARRCDRPEWITVGLLGKIHVTDDGTCSVGGYATVGENGIATASTEKTNMRVMKRVTDKVVLVFMK